MQEFERVLLRKGSLFVRVRGLKFGVSMCNLVRL